MLTLLFASVAEYVEGDAVADMLLGSHPVDGFLHRAVAAVAASWPPSCCRPGSVTSCPRSSASRRAAFRTARTEAARTMASPAGASQSPCQAARVRRRSPRPSTTRLLTMKASPAPVKTGKSTSAAVQDTASGPSHAPQPRADHDPCVSHSTALAAASTTQVNGSSAACIAEKNI